MVTVIYGMAGGLNQDDHQVLYSSQIGAYNAFGYSLAVGDFNADGKDDLAVGAPGRAFWNQPNILVGDGPGGVTVFMGKTEGFTDGREWNFDRSQTLVAGDAQAGARFGESLAAGDFNGDGYDDLLIGAPKDDVTRQTGKIDQDAGSVTLKMGGSAGFRQEPGILIHDDNEANNARDRFGSAIVAGNFNGNAYDDFAIAHNGERVGNSASAGAVTVHYGNRRFIDSGRVDQGRLLYQSLAGIPGRSESGDAFGTTLAAADFNNDGRDDLAIGIPQEDIERIGYDRNNAGAVLVMYGKTEGGFVALGAHSEFHQDKPNVRGGAENGDIFGAELSVGDYNGDGVADLLVGVPGEVVRGVTGQGVIQILHGSSVTGLVPRLDIEQMYHRGNVRSLSSRHFGTALPH